MFSYPCLSHLRPHDISVLTLEATRLHTLHKLFRRLDACSGAKGVFRRRKALQCDIVFVHRGHRAAAATHHIRETAARIEVQLAEPHVHHGRRGSCKLCQHFVRSDDAIALLQVQPTLSSSRISHQRRCAFLRMQSAHMHLRPVRYTHRTIPLSAQ